MARRRAVTVAAGAYRTWCERSTALNAHAAARRLAQARRGSDVWRPGVPASAAIECGRLPPHVREMACGPQIANDRARFREPRLASVFRDGPGRNSGRFWNALRNAVAPGP